MCLPVDALERVVDALDGEVRVEDDDPVRSGVEKRIQSLLFVGDLPVQLRVVHSNRGLVCKRLEDYAVVQSKAALIVSENKNNADNLSVCDECERCPVEQTHTGGIR